MNQSTSTTSLSTESKLTGYLHPGYADSLVEFGTPIELPRSQGRLLARRIPRTDAHDAMGCYPLFICRHWKSLVEDLNHLTGDLVSVALVADPFGAYQLENLHQCFDHVTAFKQRFVTELGDDLDTIVSKHHRYYARQALKRVRVETCGEPSEYLDEWCRLYDCLVVRHGLAGIQQFSRTTFQKQLSIKGLVMFAAYEEDQMIGAHLWMLHDEVAYSHLAAYDERGYAANVGYALYWHALHEFHKGQFNHVQRLDLGASAGTTAESDDGLSRFKRGWSNASRATWFCGRILDHDRYLRLTHDHKPSDSKYFPVYREGEFRSVSGGHSETKGDVEPVYLRPLQMDDLEKTHCWHNDASLYDTLVGEYRPVSLETEKQWLQRVSSPCDDQVNLAICLSTHEHIGNIYLRSIDRTAGTAELHTFIASGTHRLKGYATLAINQILERAFFELNLGQIYLHVLEKNAPAIRCYEKCGFHRTGILRGHVVKAGQARDVVVMARNASPIPDD